MLIMLLLIYSLGISVYLFHVSRKQGKTDDFQPILQYLTAKAEPSVAEIRAIAEIAKVRRIQIPWHERSISAIGIVAFFSMLVATSFQTINAAKAEIESSILKQEIQSLEAQRASWNRLIRDLSEVIVLKASNDKLEKSEEGVLKQRLSELDKIDKPDNEADSEKLKIYLALRLYDNASALIEKSKVLGDSASPENIIFLAEMSYLDGSRAKAKVLLKRFERSLSNQPIDWQVRFYVLSAALSSDPKLYVNEIAALKHMSPDDANQWIESKVNDLKSQAKRRSVALDAPQGDAQPSESAK
jgi:hypothetical protein